MAGDSSASGTVHLGSGVTDEEEFFLLANSTAV